MNDIQEIQRRMVTFAKEAELLAQRLRGAERFLEYMVEPTTNAFEERDRLRRRVRILTRALVPYAKGHHFLGDLFTNFESVSGEPSNQLCGGLGFDDVPEAELREMIGQAMVEDGSVALQALKRSKEIHEETKNRRSQ